MSWAKLSDDYGDDCWTLSDQAFRLHTEALVWNGRKLLDCRISKEDVRRFAKHPEAVKELLDCGWWSEDGDFYIIRHHAVYQRTREAVVNQQEANAKNGAKGGRPKKPREQASELRPKSLGTHWVSESLSERETERDRTGQDAVTGTTDKKAQADKRRRDDRKGSKVSDGVSADVIPDTDSQTDKQALTGSRDLPSDPRFWKQPHEMEAKASPTLGLDHLPGRCPSCAFHVATQGHGEGCPERQTG